MCPPILRAQLYGQSVTDNHHSPLNRSDEEHAPIYRSTSSYNPLHTFQLPSGQERHYQQQYGDMYFLRLAKLKPAVEEIAVETWEGLSVRIARRVSDGMGRILCAIAPYGPSK